MRVEGGRRLARQLRSLPDAQRKHVSDAIDKSLAEGVRVARVLVPERSGNLRDSIEAERAADGMSGRIVAGDDTKRGEIKAHTVEGGRDPASRGGAMDAQPYIGPTRSYLAKKFKNRISRAIRKAAKEAARHG